MFIFLYIFISFQRLESFDFKASVGDGDDENAEKRWGVAGLLYGLGVPHLSRHSVVLNASGKVLEEEQIKGEMEICYTRDSIILSKSYKHALFLRS